MVSVKSYSYSICDWDLAGKEITSVICLGSKTSVFQNLLLQNTATINISPTYDVRGLGLVHNKLRKLSPWDDDKIELLLESTISQDQNFRVRH